MIDVTWLFHRVSSKSLTLCSLFLGVLLSVNWSILIPYVLYFSHAHLAGVPIFIIWKIVYFLSYLCLSFILSPWASRLFLVFFPPWHAFMQATCLHLSGVWTAKTSVGGGPPGIHGKVGYDWECLLHGGFEKWGWVNIREGQGHSAFGHWDPIEPPEAPEG